MRPQACAGHAQRLVSMLRQQREQGQFCDVVLSVSTGEEYLAHRNVLACFSQLIQDTATTTSSTSSTTSPSMKVDLPQECPSDGLELLLDFFYSGELKKLESVSWKRVHDAASALWVSNALVPPEPPSSPPRTSVTSETEMADLTIVEGNHDSNNESAIDNKLLDGLDKVEPVFVPQRSRGRQKAARHENSNSSAAESPASVTVTTTRSGRRVKEPRWLVGQNEAAVSSPTGLSRQRQSTPASKEEADGKTGKKQTLDGSDENAQTSPAGKDTDLQEDDTLDNDDGNDANDDDDNDDDNDFVDALSENLDEEYTPSSSHSATSTSAGQRSKRRCQAKPVGSKERGDDATKEGRKGSVQCPTCHKTFLSKYYLKVHNRRHTGEKPFKCEKCEKCYYRKENLLEHQRRNCQSRTEMVFSCSRCSKTFPRRQELRIHMVSHTGEMPNKCTSCPEQFMQKKDLRIHMIKVHGAPKPHACSLCTKCFFSRTELKLHEASKHRGEKLFVCEECGHRASSRNGLQMHIKAIHRNERPFVCEFCNHAFTQKANLNMHLRTHTGEKPFQCHLCGKTFRTQASLDKHNRTHTGERPYACEFCQQRFTEKGPLLRHIASKHQEGRPHYCQICSKTFKAVEQLRVHVRRHKGMRKFECSECGYKFTRQAHLRRHAQIHNRVENYNPRQRRLRNLIIDGNADKGATSSSSSPPPCPPANQEAAAMETQSDVIRVMIQSGPIIVGEVGPGQSEEGEPGSGEGQTAVFPVASASSSGTDAVQTTFTVLPTPGAPPPATSDGDTTEFSVVTVLDPIPNILVTTDAFTIHKPESED